MRTLTRGFLSLCLALLISGTPCLASQVRPINLEQMAQKAGHIVSGRCTSVEVGQDPALRIPVTTVTLEVEHSLKGRGGRTLTFRMAGGSSGPGAIRIAGGTPSFAPGEEVVLFLYPTSRAGLTSPVGLGQGKFVVRRDKAGRSLAVNGVGNRGLLKGLSSEARDHLGFRVEPDQVAAPVARDQLLAMVRDLLPRGEAR